MSIKRWLKNKLGITQLEKELASQKEKVNELTWLLNSKYNHLSIKVAKLDNAMDIVYPILANLDCAVDVPTRHETGFLILAGKVGSKDYVQLVTLSKEGMTEAMRLVHAYKEVGLNPYVDAPIPMRGYF